MHLFRAIYSPPLEKIRLIFESYMLLKDDEEKVEMLKDYMEEEELEEVERLYQVCLDLMETQSLRNNYSNYAFIPWSFSYDEVENYLYWINPKARIYFRNIPMSSEQAEEFEEIVKNYSKLPIIFWIYDFGKSGWINWTTAKDIKNQFINYVMPIASKLMSALIEAVVSPDV